MSNYWAFAANPKIYQIQDAVANLEFDNWTIKRSKVQKGDRVIFWKTLGKDKNRGIISFGEVLDDPRIYDDPENEFWVDKNLSQIREYRVPIRYIKSSRMPIWIGGKYDDVLLRLTVANAQGGTVFRIEPDLWDAVINICGGWPGDFKLEKYAEYSRRDIHSIFSPDTSFFPQTGTWGLQGIVKIPRFPGNYVFLVTIGQTQGSHKFEEGIDVDGVLTWQSQPRQTLKDDQIQDFINHDELKNSIYLFFRTGNKEKYLYLGKLKYLNHDGDRECPVFFKWQILDWYPGEVPNGVISNELPISKDEIVNKNSIELTQPPNGSNKNGKSTHDFRGRTGVDFADQDSRNRKLGKLGEKLVLLLEKDNLKKAGQTELCEKVRHISEIIGDGAGYDIESYSPNGELKYIEVKTTRGSINSSFYLSSNEYSFYSSNKEHYFLYRIYEYDEEANSGKCFIIKNLDNLIFTPTQFRVTF
jgi:hypothetical protein